ncbi:MAG: chromatin protein Cren7 [Desulfurococcaceae archaeon]
MSKQNIKCPKCGSTEVDVVKTWQLTSPIPDKYGRITVTVMGSIVCKTCNHSWRSVLSKIKIGDKGIAINDKEIAEEEGKRRVKEIVIDIDDILRENEEE